jgi:hypothetical protein
MDWVKPKHRARRLKSAESAEAENQTAMQWLERLCEENVTLLQSSLPVGNAASKVKSSDLPIDRYLNAMLWGTGDWEVAKPSHREFLNDLVEAFGSQPFSNSTRPTSLHRKKKSPAVSPEIRSQQVAHATKIGKWITQQLPKSSYDPYVALTCAGWLHALPEVGRDIPPALWLEVLQSTLTQVDRAWANGNEEGLFPWVIWACEVPLALAKQLSHLGGKDRIVSETLNRIALILEQSAESHETLLSFGAQDLRAVVASLVRSRWAANSVGARKWYPPQRKALSKLLTTMLHLTDAEGKAMLTEAHNTRHDADLWTAVMELCGANKKALLAAAAALPDDVGTAAGFKPSKIRKDKSNDARLPKPSVYWEKSNVVSMRRSWRDVGCRVVADFSSDVIWLDITDEKGQRVFSGDWDVELTRNGKPVNIDVAWQEVCWFSDDDVDYLELECDLEGTCKIQRQLMLMREEGIVFMADAVIAYPAASGSHWQLRSSWKLDDRIAFEGEAKTTEGRLMRSKGPDDADGSESHSHTPSVSALVMPIGFSEWKRGLKSGGLSAKSKTLVMETPSDKDRFYAPLVVALKGAAKTPVYTWRQLTLAQDLKIVAGDAAQGFRVQIGKDQWVIYRSLTPCIRRTLMGLHLNTEFYAARFQAKDGSYEPMIEVNPE